MRAEAWLKRFEQLTEYKAIHDHCNVPRKYKEDQSLAEWVSGQRKHWKKGTLDPEREEMLTGLGFIFDMKSAHAWLKRFEELKNQLPKNQRSLN